MNLANPPFYLAQAFTPGATDADPQFLRQQRFVGKSVYARSIFSDEPLLTLNNVNGWSQNPGVNAWAREKL